MMLSSLLVVLSGISFNTALAQEVSGDTEITVVRPEKYDSETCDATVFSGRVSELSRIEANKNALFAATPENKMILGMSRSAVTVNELVVGRRLPIVSFIGGATETRSIQLKLLMGEALKLTEYKKCKELNPDLILVDFIEYTSKTPYSVNLSTQLTAVRKTPDGACGDFVNKTFLEIVKASQPAIVDSNLIASVNVRWNALDGATQTIVSKRITISFAQKMALGTITTTNPLRSPQLVIEAPFAIADQILAALSDSTPQLKFTGLRDCFGERADAPFRITGFSTTQ